MKYFSILLLITLSGCVDKYHVIHKALIIPKQCEFEKFTESEKDSMIEEVGRKIYRNQSGCIIRQDRIDTLIEEHNEAHKE